VDTVAVTPPAADQDDAVVGVAQTSKEFAMKQGIHPEYKTATVTCGCGNSFETRATVDRINVELCSACHPFYTGKQKLVDVGGRVDRFRRRMEKAGK
jgi:large subunit ribosomal protein L31